MSIISQHDSHNLNVGHSCTTTRTITILMFMLLNIAIGNANIYCIWYKNRVYSNDIDRNVATILLVNSALVYIQYQRTMEDVCLGNLLPNIDS